MLLESVSSGGFAFLCCLFNRFPIQKYCIYSSVADSMRLHTILTVKSHASLSISASDLKFILKDPARCNLDSFPIDKMPYGLLAEAEYLML